MDLVQLLEYKYSNISKIQVSKHPFLCSDVDMVTRLATLASANVTNHWYNPPPSTLALIR